MNEERRLVTSSKLIKNTLSSSIPKLSMAQQGGASLPSTQASPHHPERSLKQWPPYSRLPAAVYSKNIRFIVISSL
jgi:hypothetical protein